ncbi:MAG: PilZ domain-containing protein [Thermodesulfobacteriota bacterium]
MTKQREPGVERRKHERIFLHKDAFAVIKPGTNRLLVPVLDISLGGLAFQYTDKLKWRDNAIRIDLIIPDEEFYLQGLPVKRIVDMEIIRTMASGKSNLRKQSLQFADLSSMQSSWLDHFISQYRKPRYTGPERRSAPEDRRSGLDRRILK